MSRVLRAEEPDSAWWGDGAAAAVIGPVGADRGVLAIAHNADGANRDALVLGVPGKHWWDDGAMSSYAQDRDQTRAMLLGLVDRAAGSIADALAAAKLAPGDVGFYASHQGTAWLASATAAEAGLDRAKTIATFPAFGNLNSANVPLVLAVAEREQLLADDTVVVAFSGGVGETWSATCLRWGR
jgi:3-oxoacyl-[acyl-carrier-protein] synthase-3